MRTRAVVLEWDRPLRAGLEHVGELVDLPDGAEGILEHAAERGTAQQASARATRRTGSAERQRPRSVRRTCTDRPDASPKSLALASRLRNAPLRTPL